MDCPSRCSAAGIGQRRLQRITRVTAPRLGRRSPGRSSPRPPPHGLQGLLISTGALRLTGVTELKSQAILPFLQAHASSPNYTVSFGWKLGDFVLWDSLATWHYAVND
jgi:alpha-ketoglutarate-dependent taurine dioxygenase